MNASLKSAVFEPICTLRQGRVHSKTEEESTWVSYFIQVQLVEFTWQIKGNFGGVSDNQMGEKQKLS